MSNGSKPRLGPGFKKIQPKLRVIANGEQDVNEVRCQLNGSLALAPRCKVTASLDTVTEMVQEAQQTPPEAARKAPAPGDQKEVPKQTLVSVFIERIEPDAPVKGLQAKKPVSRTIEAGNLVTAVIPLDRLSTIAAQDTVVRIEMGEGLKAPRPRIHSGKVRPPRASSRRVARHSGKDVLIGIIDVGGFDFAHPDFLNHTGTRFLRIWDQGGTHRPSPPRFGYGAEIKKQHLDAAMKAAPRQKLPAQLLEPQSQAEYASHGTHVASIAAGNRGVCPKAFLAGVLIDLPEADLERRRSFYDSTRIAHAVDYLFDLAEELRKENGLATLPVSINISLGTNGHAHDGSSAVNRWLDSALTTPGRAICVAAGNAGQEQPEAANDFGWIMGRIHTAGRIPSRGLVKDIEWEVIGNGLVDVSENEMEIWYSPADRFAVSLRHPDGTWTEPVQPGQFIENRQLSQGAFVSIYNEPYHPANGANYIGLYLSPYMSSARQKIIGIPSGKWVVRLHGEEVRDGAYHAWIERDDPGRIGPVGERMLWRFPSYFTTLSNIDECSVSSLGCGYNIVCVANLDEPRQKIHISSSQGPTRDGRFKPDVAAAGTDIVAALGFNFDDNEEWVAMTGTSMASPFVTGVVGLMLAENPKLTAAQVCGILQRTARPLPGVDYRWRNEAGYGIIDPAGCLKEAKLLLRPRDIT
jgi:subtilisin family serine protease